MDRRLTPSNGRVAAAHLKDVVAADRYVKGRPASIIVPIADLLDAPDGNLDRQLLLGAPVTVFEENSPNGYAFVQSRWDGYVGYVGQNALGPKVNSTHRVTALATHVYPELSIKTRPICALSLGSDVCVSNFSDGMAELETGGFIPSCHLSALNDIGGDWVSIAEKFLDVPYLWGGNSAFGIDCAGLVQMALRQVGVSVPADSDLQESASTLIHQSDSAERTRGLLVFWPGHVAIFQDEIRIIHANGHHMSVRSENFEIVCQRISASSGEHPTTFGRFEMLSDRPD